jgi:aryl carrier-like protein
MEHRLPESPALSEDTADPATLTVLLECTSTVLQQPVAPSDQFLDLGGDSLTALRLVALLGTRGFQLDVGDVFEQDDMTLLARHMVDVALTGN